METLSRPGHGDSQRPSGTKVKCIQAQEKEIHLPCFKQVIFQFLSNFSLIGERNCKERNSKRRKASNKEAFICWFKKMALQSAIFFFWSSSNIVMLSLKPPLHLNSPELLVHKTVRVQTPFAPAQAHFLTHDWTADCWEKLLLYDFFTAT